MTGTLIVLFLVLLGETSNAQTETFGQVCTVDGDAGCVDATMECKAAPSTAHKVCQCKTAHHSVFGFTTCYAEDGGTDDVKAAECERVGGVPAAVTFPGQTSKVQLCSCPTYKMGDDTCPTTGFGVKCSAPKGDEIGIEVTVIGGGTNNEFAVVDDLFVLGTGSPRSSCQAVIPGSTDNVVLTAYGGKRCGATTVKGTTPGTTHNMVLVSLYDEDNVDDNDNPIGSPKITFVATCTKDSLHHVVSSVSIEPQDVDFVGGHGSDIAWTVKALDQIGTEITGAVTVGHLMKIGVEKAANDLYDDNGPIILSIMLTAKPYWSSEHYSQASATELYPLLEDQCLGNVIQTWDGAGDRALTPEFALPVPSGATEVFFIIEIGLCNENPCVQGSSKVLTTDTAPIDCTSAAVSQRRKRGASATDTQYQRIFTRVLKLDIYTPPNKARGNGIANMEIIVPVAVALFIMTAIVVVGAVLVRNKYKQTEVSSKNPVTA